MPSSKATPAPSVPPNKTPRNPATATTTTTTKQVERHKTEQPQKVEGNQNGVAVEQKNGKKTLVQTTIPFDTAGSIKIRRGGGARSKKNPKNQRRRKIQSDFRAKLEPGGSGWGDRFDSVADPR